VPKLSVAKLSSRSTKGSDVIPLIFSVPNSKHGLTGYCRRIDGSSSPVTSHSRLQSQRSLTSGDAGISWASGMSESLGLPWT
jgi:hypothetical protein